MSGVCSLAATGGGNTTPFALNAATTANNHTALLSANARTMRASEELYRFGAFFAGLFACERRYAGRQCLSIAGAVRTLQRKKPSKSIPKIRGGAIADCRLSRPRLFFVLSTAVE